MVTGQGVVEVAGLLVGTAAQILEAKASALRIVAVVVVVVAAAAGVEAEEAEDREIDGRRDRREVMVVGPEAVNSGRQACHVNETERRQQGPEKELKSDWRQPELWEVRQVKRAWREYGRERTGAWASRHGARGSWREDQ